MHVPFSQPKERWIRAGKRIVSPPLVALVLAFSVQVSADGDREIITAEEIEQQKPATLMELLNRRVGLGSSSHALSLRGVSGVALYVDGFSRGTSALEIEKIKPQDVARIEIVRGAASSRYGADALGGAVVITTRQGASHWGMDVVQGYNSFDSRYSRAIGSGTFGDAGMRLSFEDSLTNKTMVMDRHNNPLKNLVQTMEAFETKREGDFKANYRRDWLTAAVNVAHIEQTRNFGRPNQHNEYVTVRSKGLVEAVFGELKLSANLLYEDNRLDVFRDGGKLDATGLAPYLRGPENLRTVSTEFQANYGNLNLGLFHGNDWEFIDQHLVAGHLRQFSLKDNADRLGLFGSYGHDFFEHGRLEMGGRYDRYEYSDITVFDSQKFNREPPSSLETFNPKLGLSWRALSWLNLHGSAATGFIPPSPQLRYYRMEQPDYRIVPNPNLKPQQSLTVDFGIDADYGSAGKANLTFFYTRWTDKFTTVTTAGTPSIKRTLNIGESVSKGAEAGIIQPLTEHLNASLNYTLNFTEITDALDPANIGNRLPYQPLHRLNAALDYKPPWAGTVRLNLHYESEQFMLINNVGRDAKGYVWRNGDFATVDFLATRKFSVADTGIDLTFGINNLLDVRYAKHFFERDPGRVIRGELGLHF